MLHRPRLLLPLALVGALLVALPLSQITETGLELRLKDALGVGQRAAGCEEARPVRGWQALAPMPTPIDEPRAVTIGDDVYVVGGLKDIVRSGGPEPLPGVERLEVEGSRDAWRYDPQTGRFARLPPLPEPLNHTAAATYRGDLYVVGGHGNLLWGVEPKAGLYRFSPDDDRWERLAPMPTARGAIAVGVIGDRLYVAGGMIAGRPVRHLEAYDFRSGRWEARAPMPTAREHIAGAAVGGGFYVLGGRSAQDYSLPVVERYDPARDRWEKLPEMPEGTGGADAVAVDGDIVVLGGGDDREARVTGTVQRFDTAARRWSLMPGGMRAPRHGFAAALVGDAIYTFGGSDCAYFHAQDTVDRLDVAALPA